MPLHLPASINRCAIGVPAIADAVHNLQIDNYLTSDVAVAIQHIPEFHFDPKLEPYFYSDRRYETTDLEKMEAAEVVLRKFDRWYPRAHDETRVFLGIASLINSSEQFDNIVQHVLVELRTKHSMKFVVDEQEFEIGDYHALHDPANIEAVLSTPKIKFWCKVFSEQARRTAAMPSMPYETFTSWLDGTLTIFSELDLRAKRLIGVTGQFGTIKKDRRVLNKSIRLFESFFGPQMARKFIAGKNLWLKGHHFVWKLKIPKRGKMMRDTVDAPTWHTPFKITICDRETMNELANGCVLFEKMPILDQAVAFWLHMQTPEDEMEFFLKTNLSNLTEFALINEPFMACKNAKEAHRYTGATARRHRRYRLFEGDEADDEAGEEEEGTREYTQAELDAFQLEIDPSIDDDPIPLDLRDDDYWDARDRREREYEEYRYDLLPYYNGWSAAGDDSWPMNDLDDPLGRAFCCEDARIGSLRWLSAGEDTPEERQHVIELYERYARHNRAETGARSRDTVVRMIRASLIKKLDVDPAILSYMRFPEVRLGFITRTRNIPRLQAWVERKESLA